MQTFDEKGITGPMLRARYAVLIALFAAPFAMRGQESLFQSSDGATSIYTQRSTAALNFGDSKASISYVKRDTKRIALGYEVFATASSGVTSLFSSDKPKAPTGGGDFTIGTHWNYKPKSKAPADLPVGVPVQPTSVKPEGEAWWVTDVGYSRSSFYVSDAAVAASAAQRNFDRFRVLEVINWSMAGERIIGLAGGVERRNNLDDLQAVQFQTVVAPAPAGSSSSVVTSKAGYYGVYNQYVGVPIYFDVLQYLVRPDKSAACLNKSAPCNDKGVSVPGFGNRIALDAFARADAGNANRSAKGGVGVYVFKKGDALTPLGGVTVSYDGSKVQVGVTTGFSLGK